MSNILVQDIHNKMVYKVSTQRQGSDDYYLIYLELVCGWDYVNPDENDIQGYVGAENFVDDVQHESMTFYPFEETGYGRLKEEGYVKVTAEQLGIEQFVNTM